MRTLSSAIKRVVALGTGIVLLFVGVVAADVYLYAQRDEARPVDAAIVLGAGVYGRRPSPVLRERIEHAVHLYDEGTVEVIIFTGGSGESGDISEAEVAARYARFRGVPAEAILVETTSTSTWENLANAQAVATAHALDSFLVVSTPFHMRRSVALARDLGMEAYSSPTRTIRWISWYTKTRAYAREVIAYLVYLLEGEHRPA